MKKSKGFNFNNMLLLFAMVPLIIAIAVFSILSITSTKKNLESETNEALWVAANSLREYYVYDLINSGDVAYETDYVDSIAQGGIDLTLFKDNVRFFTSIKDDKGERIEGTTASDTVYAAVKAGNDYYSDSVVINNIDYYVCYLPISDANGNFWGMAFAGKPAENVSNALQSIIIKTLIYALVIIVVFIILVMILAKKVANPLAGVADSVAKIADGELDDRDDNDSTIAESKMLIASARKLQQNLSDIIGKTKAISDELVANINVVADLAEKSNDGVGQISGSIEDLAQGATSMAESVQSINEDIIQMGNAINDISDSVDNLAASSEHIKIANDEAAEFMNKVSSSSEKSVTAVHNITSQIKETNDAISKIDEAVSMIASIAGQTNLLALNASIEAARAGDAGRGFAVVATEISSLSDQSNASANQIKQIVQEIVEQSENSVRLSAEVAEVISEEQEYIKETQDKFNLLNDEIGASLEEISGIANKAKLLDNAKTSIIDSVQDLSAISEENAASTQEVSASITDITSSIQDIADKSEDMSAMAEDLNNSVSYFK